MCKREAPCGGILRVDTDVLSDTSHRGYPVLLLRCLNGHTFRDTERPPEPAALRSPVCQAHGLARPCLVCRESARRARAQVKAQAVVCQLCGRDYRTTAGRKKYCPDCRRLPLCTACQTRHRGGRCPTKDARYRWRRNAKPAPKP
jgi:hypothetical protein